MYALLILKRATDDATEIYDYYESVSEGLGERFLGVLDSCIAQLQLTPFIFQKIFDEKRQAVIDVFQVVIVYEVKEQTIYIYSVFHTSRNPDDKFIN